MVRIDGAFGEAGGQIVRTCLSLSAITGQAVEITNIRAGRSKPGLHAQHLAAVRAAAEICGAHLEGDLSEYPICQTCQAPRPSLAAMYGSLMLNSLTVRKAVPAMEKLAKFYNIGVFER